MGDSNGGFANARGFFSSPQDFSSCGGLLMEIKGDNKKYVVGVRDSPAAWGVTFEMDINSTDEWQMFEIPFDKLVSSSMGRVPNADPIDESTIYSIGLKRT